MTRTEGLSKLEKVCSSLSDNYRTLETLLGNVSRPVASDVQAKAEDIIRMSVSVTCMALNFKELPPEAKKPFAALLYAAADALSGEGGQNA